MNGRTKRSRRILRTILAADHGERVVLESWGADPAPRLHNLARVRRDGTVCWRAVLPDSVKEDCFVRAEMIGGHVVAETWQGMTVRVDPDSGRSL